MLEVAHLLGCTTLLGVVMRMSCFSWSLCHGLLCCVLRALGLAPDTTLAGLVCMLVPPPALLARTLVLTSWYTLQAVALHIVQVIMSVVAPGHTLLPVLLVPPPSELPTIM